MIRKPALAYRTMSRHLIRMSACALLLSVAATMPLHAQPGETGPERDTAGKAGRIASQPFRDVGITKDKIPPILDEAVKAPYAAPSGKRCPPIVAELNELNAALGPDFGANEAANRDKAGQLAEIGGSMIVNSLIPLRGVVREVSGAASADRRKTVAINAGLARRGYLRGLASTRGCKVPIAPPPKADKDEADKKG
jgi:hypothetical protein